MTSDDLSVRSVLEQDRKLLWNWANDPATRAASFNREAISWENHVAWLDRKLRDPSCLIYVAEGSDVGPIGVVRFDATGDHADVSVTLAPEQRKKGLAARVIDCAVRELFRVSSALEVRAFVRPENAASLRAFERASFVRVPSPRQGALCLMRKRPRSAAS